MSIESRSHQYGVVFGHWQIGQMLGSGSGGKTAVFRLSHTDTHGMQSALKVVNLIEDQGGLSRISDWQKQDYQTARDNCKNTAAEEVRLMNEFQGNTHIVDYLDHEFINWEEENRFGCDMLVRMELLQDLRGRIRQGTAFEETEIIKVGLHMAQALVLCHGREIIHRDIKPENIFINRNGDYKLGDFGISRIVSSGTPSMASTNIGTPAYMAPEQSSGQYDHRVDIYSLGLVLYELSNRMRLPFATSSYVRMEDIQKRLAGIPMSEPCQASPALAAVILKACAHDPGQRYGTARQLLEALQAVQNPQNPTVFPKIAPQNPPVSPYQTMAASVPEQAAVPLPQTAPRLADAAKIPRNPLPVQPAKPQSPPWECACGCRNPGTARYCDACFQDRPRNPFKPISSARIPSQHRATPAGSLNTPWECACGCRNPSTARYCDACFQNRP